MPLALTLSNSKNNAIMVTHKESGNVCFIFPTMIKSGKVTTLCINDSNSPEFEYDFKRVDKDIIKWPGKGDKL